MNRYKCVACKDSGRIEFDNDLYACWCVVYASQRLGKKKIQIRETLSPFSIKSSAFVADIAKKYFYGKKQEHLLVIPMNSRNIIIDVVTVYIGTVNSVFIRRSEVLRPSIIENAPAFIIAHNHPSGNPFPSSEDDNVTVRIREAAKTMDIEFLDHIIVGNAGQPEFQEYYSYADRGRMYTIK